MRCFNWTGDLLCLSLSPTASGGIQRSGRDSPSSTSSRALEICGWAIGLLVSVYPGCFLIGWSDFSPRITIVLSGRIGDLAAVLVFAAGSHTQLERLTVDATPEGREATVKRFPCDPK